MSRVECPKCGHDVWSVDVRATTTGRAHIAPGRWRSLNVKPTRDDETFVSLTAICLDCDAQFTDGTKVVTAIKKRTLG